MQVDVDSMDYAQLLDLLETNALTLAGAAKHLRDRITSDRSIPLSSVRTLFKSLSLLGENIESRITGENRPCRFFCENCGRKKQRKRPSQNLKGLYHITYGHDDMVLCSRCLDGLSDSIDEERKGWRKYKHLSVVPQLKAKRRKKSKSK